MSSIPPLSNLLISRDTDIEVTGTLGHRKVSFKKGAKVENYSLTQVLEAIKNVAIPEGSPELKSLKEKVDIIQDACRPEESKVTTQMMIEKYMTPNFSEVENSINLCIKYLLTNSRAFQAKTWLDSFYRLGGYNFEVEKKGTAESETQMSAYFEGNYRKELDSQAKKAASSLMGVISQQVKDAFNEDTIQSLKSKLGGKDYYNYLIRKVCDNGDFESIYLITDALERFDTLDDAPDALRFLAEIRQFIQVKYDHIASHLQLPIHYEVSLKKDGTVDTNYLSGEQMMRMSFALQMDAQVKDVYYSLRKEFNEDYKAEVVNSSDILSTCNDILTQEITQQAQEINEEKKPLIDHFASIDSVGPEELLKLAPYLSHVNLTGIETKIEESIEGGIDTFLHHCSTMSFLKVSSTSLTSIDAPHLLKLECKGCTGLTSINAPNLEELDCEGCIALESINTPNLRTFDSFDTTKYWCLQEITAPPSLFSHIEIQKDVMKEKPEEYLSKLIPYFLINKQWPSVEFIESDGSKSPGIDATGLRKDAQSTLIQALFSEGKSTLGVDDDLKPYLDVNIDDIPIRSEDIQKWRALGYIMGTAFKENLLTGGMFSPKVFETLKEAVQFKSNEDTHIKDLQKNLIQTLLQDESDAVLDYIPTYVPPILALADGIKTILSKRELADFLSLEVHSIQEHIEGSLSADAIIKKLQVSARLNPAVENFLYQWIKDREEKLEELEAFLIAVTGSRTVSPKMPKIKILDGADGHLPVSHTCFNQLELSNVDTQETFNKNMALFLASSQAGSGFTNG